MSEKIISEFLDKENVETIIKLIADPDTEEGLRIRLIRRILESRHTDNFFRTIFDEKLSYGSCPNCNSFNHWLIPETELNKMGYVSHETDERIPQFTDSESCNKFAQACKKKKIIV